MSHEKTEGEEQKVDILGTQAQALPSWEERAKDLARYDLFKVTINPSAYLLAHLTGEESKRLFKKLRLVSNAAKYMAAGMVKGTVKYATDDYDLKQWFAHLIGEGADQMNYQMLLFQAWYAEQDHAAEIAEVAPALEPGTVEATVKTTGLPDGSKIDTVTVAKGSPEDN